MAEASYYSTPMGPVGPKKKPEKIPKTMRFTLDLADSNELSCPEFSWLKLLSEAAEYDEEKLKECMDPFAAQDLEEQKKLEVLARTFEEKYKKLNNGKKKRKFNFQDLLDVGDGYDDTDPFVDNSEAYDELVPETLTTKLGGFYINSGQLDFKEVSIEHSDDDEEPAVMKIKKRKLRIESDEESESGTSNASDVKKRQKIIKKIRQDRRNSSDLDKKQKKILTEEEIIKKKKIEKAKKLKKAALTGTPMKMSHSENGSLKSLKNGPSSSSAHMDLSTLDSTFDEVLGKSKPSTPIKPPPTNDKTTPPLKYISGINDSDNGDGSRICPESAPVLPTELSPDLKGKIDKIKEFAKDTNAGKHKFFDDPVNDLLLGIELATRQIPCSQRSTIYTHLAAYLPCGKETIIKRAKKLREQGDENKLEGPMKALTDAINDVMPALIEKYEKEVEVALAIKSLEDKSENKEGVSKEKESKDGAGSTAESEGDDDDKLQNGEEKKRKCLLPRKKFIWTDEIRKLLCHVVHTKMRLYETSKQRTQSVDEYIRNFLDADVRKLWPKGWIQTRMLYKESKSVHTKSTVASVKEKPKKILFPKTPTTNPTTNPTTSSVSSSRILEKPDSKPEAKSEPKLNNENDEGITDIFSLLDDAEDVNDTKDVKADETDTVSDLMSFLQSQGLSELDIISEKTKEVSKPKIEIQKASKIEIQKASKPEPKPRQPMLQTTNVLLSTSVQNSTQNVVKSTVAKIQNSQTKTTASSQVLAKSTVSPSSSKSTLPPSCSKSTMPPSSSKSTIPPSCSKSTMPPSSSKSTMPPSCSKSTMPPSCSKSTMPPSCSKSTIPPSCSKSTMPPPPASSFGSASSGFLSQFEKFAKQSRPVEPGSPEKRSTTPTAGSRTNFYSAGISSPVNLSPERRLQEDILRSPPKPSFELPRPSFHASPPSPVSDIMSPNISASDYMNSLSKYAQQKQQSTSNAPSSPRIWSPHQQLSSPVPSYISPISTPTNYPQTPDSNKISTSNLQSNMAASLQQSNMAANLQQSNMAATLQQSNMAATLQQSNMAATLAQRQYTEQLMVAQRQSLAYANSSSAAAAAMGTSSMYGLPTVGLSQRSPVHSPQGIYPAHSPANTSVPGSPHGSVHPFLNQQQTSPISPHARWKYAQDKQQRPY